MEDLATAVVAFEGEVGGSHLPLTESAALAPVANAEAMLALHQLNLDTMAHGVCMFDAEQRAVLFNRQYLAMFDFVPDAVRAGTTFREMLQHLADRGLLPEVSVERLWRERCVRIAQGKPFSIRRQRPNGMTIAVHFRPAGNGSWVCVCEDVTRQAEMEYVLRQQVELLDQAIGNISQGLCMYGPDARLIICNDQYLRMYGLDSAIIKPGCLLREDMEHRKSVGSFAGDPEEYCSIVLARVATGKPFDRLWESADGRAIHIIHRPMRDGGWVSTHDDITEMRRAENAMHASNHVLESTFEHMDQGITIFDADLKLLAANRRCRELLDIPEELCKQGTPFRDIVRFNAKRGEYGPGDAEAIAQEREAAARRFEPHSFQRQLSNGTIIEVRGGPLPGGGIVSTYTDITKRIEAEREAEAAHERLRDAFEVVPEGLALFDSEDRFVLWNRKYAELYAESSADIRVGARFEDVLRSGLAKGQYPHARGKEEAWLAERLEHHRENESAHEQALPGDRWLRVQERRTVDGGSIGIRVDITELKRREDTFKLLFESNPVPMFVFDLETFEFLAVNDTAVAHYGYSREQLLAMTALDIRHPDDRAGFIDNVRRWGNNRRAATSRHQKADGSIIEVEIYSRVMAYRGRNARFTSVIDVTDRKRAEEERDRSRAFLDTVIDAIPIAVVVKNADDLRYSLINRAGEEYYGLSRAEVIGKTAEKIFPIESANVIADHDRRLKNLPDGELFVSEHELETPSKRLRSVVVRRLAVQGLNGAPQHFVSAIEDITERKEIERQLQQAQKMEAVGNLTGGLAHDFNNLLTIIIGNLDLLQLDVSGLPSAEEKVQTILEASERGSDLTRQLLAFSRRQPLQPKVIDVNMLVQKTTQLMSRTLGANLTIELNQESDLSAVRVDESQLESALLNIAINARDAMPEGGRLLIETRNVALDSQYAARHREVAPGDYVVIEISDTGTGMPADVLARIFDPFFTTKGPGKGTGLGLSMVFGFVKQSGGHISAYSEVGRGTTFKLYLPRVDGTTTASRTVEETAHQHAAAQDAVVLAVDDDPGVRAVVVRQLREFGYQVLEADSPAVALDLLDHCGPVDLMFTDMVMPGGVDGRKLAELARAKRPGLKVLFTSGFPGAFLSNDMNLESEHFLLSKPYRKSELGEAIRGVLQATEPV